MPWRDLVALAKVQGVAVYRKKRHQVESDVQAVLNQQPLELGE